MSDRARRALCAAAALLLPMATAHAAVTISTATTKNISCTSGACTPTAKNAVLNVSDLTTMLASGNVTVNTGTGSLAAQVEDIVVAASFNWANASSLTLDAYRSVTVDQPVADNGSGAVTLTTNDGGSGGNLSFVSGGSLSFLGISNGLTINGKAYTLENTLASLASAVASNPAGAYAFASNYDANHDGTYGQSPVPTTFTGLFQGLGNTISNVTLNNTAGATAIGGMFAQVDGGMVANIGLSNLRMTAGRTAYAGGLAGGNLSGTFFGDHVSGKIKVGKALGGGLVGSNGGPIDSSYTDVEIEGRAGVGGLVGENGNGDTIANSFAVGSVKGGGSGGLVCTNEGQIVNSYATGPAIGRSGSVVGDVAAGNEGEISASYSTGKVSAGPRSNVGGFVGVNDDGTGITGSYWDTKTSGTKVGIGSGSAAGVTGLTTKQFKAALPAGFDPTIWAESPSINGGFPYLINNPPPQ
jgi:hypothetical protein